MPPDALRLAARVQRVPCHRVIASSLQIGGFCGASAHDDPQIGRKLALLSGALAVVLLCVCSVFLCAGVCLKVARERA